MENYLNQTEREREKKTNKHKLLKIKDEEKNKNKPKTCICNYSTVSFEIFDLKQNDLILCTLYYISLTNFN